MSLTGNLEDLPLLDILQIVSFSKKTGYLTIRGRGRRRDRVRRRLRGRRLHLGHAADRPPRAHARCARSATLIRARIEMALEQLIRLREGQFNFSLTEQPPPRSPAATSRPRLLSQGINAQELLLDLARGMDEDRRDSTAALEASFAPPSRARARRASRARAREPSEPAAEPPEPESAPPSRPSPPDASAPAPRTRVPRRQPQPDSRRAAGRPASARPRGPAPRVPRRPRLRTMLLVDDEADIRRVLAEHFTRGGYKVRRGGGSRGGGQEGAAPSPRRDRVPARHRPGHAHHGRHVVPRRVRGGEAAARRTCSPPVLLMTESLSGAVQAPREGDGDRELRVQARPLEARPRAVRGGPRGVRGARSWPTSSRASRGRPRSRRPRRPRAKPPARRPAAARATADELSRELAVLGQRLDELRRPQDADADRGPRHDRGQGVLRAVGPLPGQERRAARASTGSAPAPAARPSACWPASSSIPLSRALDLQRRRQRPPRLHRPLPVSALTTDLLDSIGRLKGGDAALLPLVTHRETIAILYGDNPESGRPPGRLDGLRRVHQPGRHRPRERHPPPQGPRARVEGARIESPQQVSMNADDPSEEPGVLRHVLQGQGIHGRAAEGERAAPVQDRPSRGRRRRAGESADDHRPRPPRGASTSSRSAWRAPRSATGRSKRRTRSSPTATSRSRSRTTTSPTCTWPSYQLHSTLDYREVIRIVQEIVINLIGAEAFHLFMVSEKTGRLELEISEGQAAPVTHHRHRGRDHRHRGQDGGEPFLRAGRPPRAHALRPAHRGDPPEDQGDGDRRADHQQAAGPEDRLHHHGLRAVHAARRPCRDGRVLREAVLDVGEEAHHPAGLPRLDEDPAEVDPPAAPPSSLQCIVVVAGAARNAAFAGSPSTSLRQ